MGLFSHTPAVPQMTPVEADAMLAHGDAILLDVREPGEWAAGHAPGAVHVPLGALRPETMDPNIPVIAVCRSGHRSETAAERLVAAGLDARNLIDGMTGWSRAGLPVTRDDGQPGTVA